MSKKDFYKQLAKRLFPASNSHFYAPYDPVRLIPFSINKMQVNKFKLNMYSKGNHCKMTIGTRLIPPSSNGQGYEYSGSSKQCSNTHSRIFCVVFFGGRGIKFSLSLSLSLYIYIYTHTKLQLLNRTAFSDLTWRNNNSNRLVQKKNTIFDFVLYSLNVRHTG